MKNFEDYKKTFCSAFNCEKLIEQFKKIDLAEAKHGSEILDHDYCGFGCEYIFSCINPQYYDADNKFFSVCNLIEDFYDNANDHILGNPKEIDAFLYYCPSDIKGYIFDFSSMVDKNIVIAYNGLCSKNKFNYEIIRTFTVDEFLNEYGLCAMYSITHWQVNWKKLGFSWNN